MSTSLLHFFTTVLFPPRCFGCAKKDEVLCLTCLVRTRKTLCTPHPYITSLFDFKEKMIQRAIHAIKYYHRKDLIPPLAHELARELEKTDNYRLTPGRWVLVPIPMPRLRKLFRGYNQAELIALALGKELSLPVRLDILKRARVPLRQVRTATRSERIRNQKGSFMTHENPAGLRIILIDDVTTTGATLDEARKTLLAQKAVNVLAATLAH